MDATPLEGKPWTKWKKTIKNGRPETPFSCLANGHPLSMIKLDWNYIQNDAVQEGVHGRLVSSVGRSENDLKRSVDP
ncbi:hypothetical protein AAHA92_27546 [Salvia divinorum]|uniref:Uncharacterized protein n=1 Tax=Salvia divinorum TaxID=28513 RepID=A0ABD1G6X0_SALDI